jgi:MFS family permease
MLQEQYLNTVQKEVAMKAEISRGMKIYSYRWAILGIVFFIHCVLNGTILIIAGMAAAIIPQFGLNTSQFSLIASVPFLAGFILGIPSGAWADRTSIRLVMNVGLILACIGAVGRIFATDFWSLLLCNFVMGVALAALNANSTKLWRLWFPGKMMGFAMGAYVSGATIGSATAIAIGPLIPSISMAFGGTAVLMIVSTVLWLVLARTHPDGESGVTESIVGHLSIVMRSKNLWIASILMFLIMGLALTQNSFMSVGLNLGRGVDPVAAALLTSMTNVSVSVGGFLLPSIAGRTGKMKPFLIPTALVMAALLMTGWFTPFGWYSFIIFFVQGMLMGGIIPLSKTLPALLPDIKEEHTGAAGGLQSSLQNFGAFVVPSFIITPLAGDNFNNIMIGAAVIMLLIAITAVFLPETGTSLESKKAE